MSASNTYIIERCPICKEVISPWGHRCKPAFQAETEIEALDGAPYRYGEDAKAVAEQCATTWFTEGGCVDGTHWTVYVRRVGEQTISKFEINIEFVAQAYVTDESRIEVAQS